MSQIENWSPSVSDKTPNSKNDLLFTNLAPDLQNFSSQLNKSSQTASEGLVANNVLPGLSLDGWNTSDSGFNSQSPGQGGPETAGGHSGHGGDRHDWPQHPHEGGQTTGGDNPSAGGANTAGESSNMQPSDSNQATPSLAQLQQDVNVLSQDISQLNSIQTALTNLDNLLSGQSLNAATGGDSTAASALPPPSSGSGDAASAGGGTGPGDAGAVSIEPSSGSVSDSNPSSAAAAPGAVSDSNPGSAASAPGSVSDSNPGSAASAPGSVSDSNPGSAASAPGSVSDSNASSVASAPGSVSDSNPSSVASAPGSVSDSNPSSVASAPGSVSDSNPSSVASAPGAGSDSGTSSSSTGTATAPGAGSDSGTGSSSTGTATAPGAGSDTGTTTTSSSTSAGNAGIIGFFGGDTDAAEANSISAALGKEVAPSAYLDWTQPAAQTTQYETGQYASWVAANPGEGMILGVPLTYDGQTLASTASGANDAEFTQMAQQLVAAGQGNDTIRLGVEMNGPWATDNYDGNPQDFINAYNNAAEAMKAVPGANFSFDWNPANGEYNGVSPEAYYPGNANVNSIGVDIYDQNWGNTSSTPAETWNQLTTEAGGLNELAAFAQQQGKPFAIPEYAVAAPYGQAGNANAGMYGSGDDPSFINNIADFLNTQAQNEGVAFQSYFDSPSGGVGTTLEGSPQSYAAYAQDFGNGGIDGAEV